MIKARSPPISQRYKASWDGGLGDHSQHAPSGSHLVTQTTSSELLLLVISGLSCPRFRFGWTSSALLQSINIATPTEMVRLFHPCMMPLLTISLRSTLS